MENNLDLIGKKKNYIAYLANRPRVERIGSHGLFSNEGEPVVLSKAADEVSNHTGVVWINVISLRREDAERLGYDSAAQWQDLLRSRVQLIAENYKIDVRNLKWYAAFHNESHHPHVHMVVYSKNPSEGYLTKKGIDTMRSVFAHDIFRQEFMSLYERKTEQRDHLKEQARTSLLLLLKQMQNGICHNPVIAEQMKLLSGRLQNTKGKKQYGYLKADVKAVINHIVDELAKEETVAQCYEKWLECQNEILHYYKDKMPDLPLLSEQKEFKSIKNMVIREAMKYGEGYLYAEDDETDRLEEPEEIYKDEQKVEEDVPENNTSGPMYYAKWTRVYREARGYLYGDSESEPDAEVAYEIMKEEAENGNAYAIYDMGKIYQRGIFVAPDQAAAQEWYQKALEVMLDLEDKAADTFLEYRIGTMYMHGLGTESNEHGAEKYLKMAADKKNQYAQYMLGKLYQIKEDKNIPQAVHYLTLAAKQYNKFAAYGLGKFYLTGEDIPKNIDMAVAYLE